MDITGEFRKRNAGGDGLTVTVVLAGKQQLIRLPVVGGDTDGHPVETRRVQVSRGDTLDFVAHPNADGSHDLFTWQPGVRYLPEDHPAPSVIADAARDFAGPDGIPLSHELPTYPWVSLAQVLLISNEFQFID